MRRRRRPPALQVSIELEGPVVVFPICETEEEEAQEEEARLAADLLSRSVSLDEHVRLWGEATLARAAQQRWGRA